MNHRRSQADVRRGVFHHIAIFPLAIGCILGLAGLLAFIDENDTLSYSEKTADEAQTANAALAAPSEAAVSVVVTDDAYCDGGVPMTTVGFLSIPLDGVNFRVIGAQGLEVEFSPGSYPLANGAYTWSADARPGYTLAGSSTGALLLSLACNGKTRLTSEPSGASMGSVDPAPTPVQAPATPAPATTGATNTPPETKGEDVVVSDEVKLLPRPILRLFTDNEPVIQRSIPGGEIELRVPDAPAKDIRFYVTGKDGVKTLLGKGERDDLLSEGDLVTWVYFWDTIGMPSGDYHLFASITREGGTVEDTLPVFITLAPKNAATITPRKSSAQIPFLLINPATCGDSATCLSWCASSAVRQETCRYYATRETEASALLSPRIGARMYIDSDRDGIVDFDEVNLYGTDPADQDTDNDGVPDGEEVLARTPPSALLTGGTKVPKGKATSSVATLDTEEPATILEGLARIAPELAIEEVASSAADESAPSVLSGRAFPNTFVTLYIFSRPFTQVVRSDENGKFSYTLPAGLPDGAHRVFVVIEDVFGNPLMRSAEFAFVKQGGKVGRTRPDPVVPVYAADNSAQSALFGIVALSFLAILCLVGYLAHLYMRRELSFASLIKRKEDAAVPVMTTKPKKLPARQVVLLHPVR